MKCDQELAIVADVETTAATRDTVDLLHLFVAGSQAIKGQVRGDVVVIDCGDFLLVYKRGDS